MFLKGDAQFVVLLLSGVLVITFVPSAVAVTQDVVHPGLRAVSLSLCIIVQHVLGSSTAPIVIGSLSDSLGIETAMKFLPLFPILSCILFLIGSRYYEADYRKAETSF
ncbi:MAG: hypothetical protein GY866_38030 [Proteobacteria bacterium]|nr:hypothetical protein [Pseudomonadota bacterium]